MMIVMAPAMTNSGLILIPWASSWKNLISPALEAGMAVPLSRFFLLMDGTSLQLCMGSEKNLCISVLHSPSEFQDLPEIFRSAFERCLSEKRGIS